MRGTAASTGVRYRADVDGLRAVAVLPVVAYHLSLPHMSGGFVGVDVFFVISGYLITGHLQSDIEADRFSIARFYERRLRRIGPALLGMLLIVSLTTLFYVLPAELERYGASLLAALFSSSNFFFWSEVDYFNSAAHTKPLLHTWSLAVEEQYYLAFPILLYYASKLGRQGRDAILTGLMAVSFIASAVTVYRHPDTAFYLPHLRAWELILGAALALRIAKCPDHPLVCNAAAVSGIAMIILAVMWFDTTMVFPGARALLPCLGAALVIAAGEHGTTMIGKLLSWRPLVFIGLISYSIYLWHWPLIVFTRLDNSILPETIPALLLNTLLFAATIAIAAFSWRFIEKPFRDRRAVSVPLLLRWSGASAAVVGAFAGLLLVTGGFPARYPPDVDKLARYLVPDKIAARRNQCFARDEADIARIAGNGCLKSGPGANYLLVGDSHAAQFRYGLRAVFPGSTLREETHAGCVPLRGTAKDQRCNAFNDHLYGQTLHTNGLTAVIVSALWSRTDLPRLAASMDWWNAHNLPVILIGPSPSYDSELPRLLVRAKLRNDADLPHRHQTRWIAEVDGKMAKLARQKHITYVSVYQRLCPGGVCRQIAEGGEPMVFDNTHLSRAGSIAAVEALVINHDLPVCGRGTGAVPDLRCDQNAVRAADVSGSIRDAAMVSPHAAR